jgi:hypothetical protein
MREANDWGEQVQVSIGHEMRYLRYSSDTGKCHVT